MAQIRTDVLHSIETGERPRSLLRLLCLLRLLRLLRLSGICVA